MTIEERLAAEETALLQRLPSSLRDRIKVAGEHWAWHGSWVGGSSGCGTAALNNVPVKPQIFSQLVYEVSNLEMLVRTCDDVRCVHPHHHEVQPKGRRGFRGKA